MDLPRYSKTIQDVYRHVQLDRLTIKTQTHSKYCIFSLRKTGTQDTEEMSREGRTWAEQDDCVATRRIGGTVTVTDKAETRQPQGKRVKIGHL